MTESRKTLSVQVVSITAYLIGVKEDMFTREFKTSAFHTLEAKPEAKIIRSLCMIRNALIRHNGSITSNLRTDPLSNLDKMPEYIDPAIFVYLESQSIHFIKANTKVMPYLLSVNALINEKINACRSLFPIWVEWDYIRKLFQMPRGGNEKAIRELIDEYHESMNSYPYHCYINWPIHDPRAYSDKPEDNDNQTTGNVLQNDRRFLALLYYINGAEFTEFRFVTDIGDGVKDDLASFLLSCRSIVLAVDCENSDPYKLCAVLGGLREAALRSEEPEAFSKIQKIILFDDVHTIDAWDILKNYVSVPIEHIQTERVNDHKSLVDVQLTAGVAREHYQNNVDGFLLASSDSDFWGLIKSLPTARFMVLLERDKYGNYLTDMFDLNGVGYCLMDHFAGNTDDIKIGALNKGVSEYLAERVQINLPELVEDLFSSLRVNMTDKQKDVYYNRLVKKLKVTVTDGNMTVEIKE
ncbi:MAG: hypothetical protein IJ100_03970 [Lachnospiraceae bacterium]|nr:hypothetical protein [Lachnospiraceae bacterium]